MTNAVEKETAKDLLKKQRRGAAKPLLWVGIASMAMAFAGLTSGYVVSRSALMERESWMVFSLPTYFYYSTVVILLSSVVMFLAVKSAKSGNMGNAQKALWTTLVLGVVFAILQIEGWRELYEGGVFFAGEASNPAGSWVYALSFFHLLHLGGGLIALIITTVKSAMGSYSKDNTLGIELCATFWHFLDIVWVYLFLFLLFIR